MSHFGLKTKRTDDGTVFSRIFEEGLPKLSNPMFIMLFGLTNYSKQFLHRQAIILVIFHAKWQRALLKRFFFKKSSGKKCCENPKTIWGGIWGVPSSVLLFWDTIWFNLKALMRVIKKIVTCKLFSIMVRHIPYFLLIFWYAKNIQ